MDECSKTCGGGTQEKKRKPKVQAAHGGKECDGDNVKKENCSTHQCPGKHISESFSIWEGCFRLAQLVNTNE